MIEIKNLTKNYGLIKAVKDISFTVNKGEIVGFLGPNGAGKSTTMNIITGCLSSTKGEVKICENDILDNPIEAKKHIGYLPENPPLYSDMTVLEYLKFVAELKKVSKEKRKAQIDEIVDLVKIDEVKNRLIDNLSKGYKQRVGLAQSLLGSPDVLILDEPTSGLDPNQRTEMRKVIKKLAKNHTIILSSHVLPEVSSVCDRILIINRGQIVADDTPDNLSKSFTGSSMLSAVIVGKQNAVLNNIKGISGVKKVEIISNKTSAGEEAFEYAIEADGEVDIRKPVFFECAKKSTPILEMKSMNLSLEEIFRQLTTSEEEGA